MELTAQSPFHLARPGGRLNPGTGGNPRLPTVPVNLLKCRGHPLTAETEDATLPVARSGVSCGQERSILGSTAFSPFISDNSFDEAPAHLAQLLMRAYVVLKFFYKNCEGFQVAASSHRQGPGDRALEE